MAQENACKSHTQKRERSPTKPLKEQHQTRTGWKIATPKKGKKWNGSELWTSPSWKSYVNAPELSKLLKRQPLIKMARWKMVQETSTKKLHSEERNEPYNTLNRTEQYPKQNKQHWTRTEWKIATEKKRDQNKINTVTKDKQLGKKRKKKKTQSRSVQTTSQKNWVKNGHRNQRKETLYRTSSAKKHQRIY